MESTDIFKLLTGFAGAVMLAGLGAIKFLWAENKALTKQLLEHATIFEPVLKSITGETEAIAAAIQEEHRATRAHIEAQASKLLAAIEKE